MNYELGIMNCGEEGCPLSPSDTCLLRFPKSLFGLERRAIPTATPSSPRFIRHRRRFGDDAPKGKARLLSFKFKEVYLASPFGRGGTAHKAVTERVNLFNLYAV